MTIFRNADRFKHTTETLIASSPVIIDVAEYVGASNCTNCTYDAQTRASSLPNCQTCGGRGKIPVYTVHNEHVVVLWFSSDNIMEQEVGIVAIGDCKITARYDAQPWFQACLKNKTTLDVDGTDVVVKRIVPGLFKEKVTAYCSKTQLD